MERETIGQRLKRMREEKGLTQEQLGKEVFMSRQTVSLYEKYNSQTVKETKIENWLSLADFFGVSIDYLLCRTDARNANNQVICERTGLSESTILTLELMCNEYEPWDALQRMSKVIDILALDFNVYLGGEKEDTKPLVDMLYAYWTSQELYMVDENNVAYSGENIRFYSKDREITLASKVNDIPSKILHMDIMEQIDYIKTERWLEDGEY